MIEMNCPHCGALLHIPEEYAGKTGGCTHCQGRFQVPDPTAQITPPSLPTAASPPNLVRVLGESSPGCSWKLAVSVGCLTMVLAIAACAVIGLRWGARTLKSSDLCVQALAQAQSTGKLESLLGNPVQLGIPRRLKFDAGTGKETSATMEVTVSGPKGQGNLRASGTKRADKWKFTELEITLQGSSETVKFLDVREQEAGEALDTLETPNGSTESPALDDIPEVCREELAVLERIGAALDRFALKHRYYLPALDSRPGRLQFREEDLCPEYLEDKADWEAIFGAGRYCYLGYALTNEKEGLAFAEAYRKAASQRTAPKENIAVAQGKGLVGGDKIFRLRQGIERFTITDINNPSAVPGSRIPVIVGRPQRNTPQGANVLFMDGHAEFMTYPGKFPMTKAMVSALEALDTLTGDGGKG